MPGIMMIDGKNFEYTDEKNILSVIKNAGIDLPTFCYHSELSIHGACRMCSVETATGEIIASCSEPPKNGMEIFTNSKRIQKYRKIILELLLANHDRDCTVCDITSRCQLQFLCNRYGVKRMRFPTVREDLPIDDSMPSVVRNPNKCIKCGDCVTVCENVQRVGAIGFGHRGAEVRVGPPFGLKLSETNCVNCGQCRVVCPTGAIVINNNTQKVWDAIFDTDKKVVAQIAPAVRVALGEVFGGPVGESSLGKIVACMRKLGFDEIYDTAVAADLTTIEETNEFLKKNSRNESGPLFTSCCPAWVRFVETKFPQFLDNLSSCKSPQQMFGATYKKLEKFNNNCEKETVLVSIMPCTAKKAEAVRAEMQVDGQRDVDIVITTQELAIMIKEMGIDFENIAEEAMDMPFGLPSGAGVIFGATGGVAESVLRKILHEKMSKSGQEVVFKNLRGLTNCKEAVVEIGGRSVSVAVVHGLANAEILLNQIASGEKKYDLVEVMACKGGCVAGGGQPIPKIRTGETRRRRASGLYGIDSTTQLKSANDNKLVISLYDTIFKESTDALHTKK